jgi:hypothetical protein
VEPHYKFFGLGIVNNPGPFKDTTFGDFGSCIGRHGQGNAFIFPVIQVGRRIAAHTNLGCVAQPSLGFKFAKPVVFSVMEQNAPSVRIDMYSLIIGPDSHRSECIYGCRFFFLERISSINGDCQEKKRQVLHLSGAFKVIFTKGQDFKIQSILLAC